MAGFREDPLVARRPASTHSPGGFPPSREWARGATAGSLSCAEGLGERTVKGKVNGEDRVATYAAAGKPPAIVEAFEKAKKASSKAEIVDLMHDSNLPREAIPIQERGSIIFA